MPKAELRLRKVLIIESAPGQELLMRFLTRSDVKSHVLVAHSCFDAVRILKTFRREVSVIISDTIADDDGVILPAWLRLRPELSGLKILLFSDEPVPSEFDDLVTRMSKDALAPLLSDLGLLIER